MSPSGMWHDVGIMKTNVSEDCVDSSFRVERIRERETALAVG
jgi:hypothetical protein